MNARSVAPSLRSRRHEATDAEILAAAERVFARRPYAAATMQEIAAEAGCAVGTLYLYHPTKERLFRAIEARTVHEIVTGVTRAMTARGRAVDRLRAGVRQLVAYFNAHRPLFLLLFSPDGPGAHPCIDLEGHLEGEALAGYRRFRAQELAVIRAGQDEGSIRRDLPAETLQSFLYLNANAFLALWSAAQPPPPVRTQELTLWRLLSGGIRGGEGR